jgi:hypothetical protein
VRRFHESGSQRLALIGGNIRWGKNRPPQNLMTGYQIGHLAVFFGLGEIEDAWDIGDFRRFVCRHLDQDFKRSGPKVSAAGPLSSLNGMPQ